LKSEDLGTNCLEPGKELNIFVEATSSPGRGTAVEKLQPVVFIIAINLVFKNAKRILRAIIA